MTFFCNEKMTCLAYHFDDDHLPLVLDSFGVKLLAFYYNISPFLLKIPTQKCIKKISVKLNKKCSFLKLS